MTEPTSSSSPDAEQETMHDVSGDQAQQPAEQVDPIQAAKDARAERHPDTGDGDQDQAEATAGDVQADDQADDGEQGAGGTSGQ
jgi:hypothetical protein